MAHIHKHAMKLPLGRQSASLVPTLSRETGARPPLGLGIPEYDTVAHSSIHFPRKYEACNLQVKNRNIEGRKRIFGVESKNRKFLFISNL